jgi:hypothetical protein
MDEIILGVPNKEKIFIGGDLNGHVGKDSGGFERVHGYGVRNELGDTILDFATVYDLILTNTWFKKRESLNYF